MKYNLLQIDMPVFEGKKVELVGVKVNQQMLDEFGKISKDLDRPMSYVVRELALRGLAQYMRDGNLKGNSNIKGFPIFTKNPINIGRDDKS